MQRRIRLCRLHPNWGAWAVTTSRKIDLLGVEAVLMGISAYPELLMIWRDAILLELLIPLLEDGGLPLSPVGVALRMLGMERVVEADASLRNTLAGAKIFAQLTPKAVTLGVRQLVHDLRTLRMQKTPEMAVICKERPALRMLHETGTASSLLAIALLKGALLQLEARPVPLKHLSRIGRLAGSSRSLLVVARGACHLVFWLGCSGRSIYKPQSILGISILGILFWASN